MMIMLSLRTSRRALALGAGVLLFAGCSSGSTASQVATLDTNGGSNADSATTTTVDTQDALLAYAQCMRDNGVDMQDPTVDADGNVQGGGFGPDSGIDPRSTEFQTAQTACGDLLQGVAFGGGGGGRFDRTAIQDGLNSYTQCLRDQGLDVDDISFGAGGQGGPPAGGTLPAGGPTGSGGGFNGGPPGSPPANGGGGGGGNFDPTDRIVEQLGLDKSDPATATALEACASVLTDAFSAAQNTTDTSEAG